jgi:hypothetical protein
MKNSKRFSSSGFLNHCATIMRRWFANSSGGFAVERILPSSSGSRRCWSEPCEGNSTIGRKRRGPGLHSSSSSTSSPDHSIETLPGRSRKIQRLSHYHWKEEIGHYGALRTPWEKTFFFLPLGHSEDLKNLELAIRLADELVEQAPAELHRVLAHSASQARGHRDVIARFGRHPHRNAVLNRQSTPEELDYLAAGQLVHRRPIPR